MTTASEYLVRHGRLGDFGRFRAEPALLCVRGERVVVRTHRGLELGEVLGAAGAEHVPFLPNVTVGALVRHATAADLARDGDLAGVAVALLARAAELAATLDLPLEFLDAEVLLDGKRGVLHHLSAGPGDPRDVVSALAREFDLTIELCDLSEVPPEAEPEGCGSGGCGSCGSGGGCGSCGSKKKESREHFSRLRDEMERRRVPLL